MLLKIVALILVFGNSFVEVDAGYATNDCSTTSPAEDGNRIWLAMLNGAANQINLIDYSNNSNNQTISHYNSNSDIVTAFSSNNSLYFEIPENISRHSWTAFQAIALAYDPKLNLSCPFSSQNFDFAVNSELIIPIASEFINNSADTYKACNWGFTLNSTKNQKLKVVIKKLNLNLNFNLTLYADGKVAHVFNDTVYYMPAIKYFDGINFNLTFTNQQSNSSYANFFILVSAVFKSDTFTKAGCINPDIKGTETTFSNIDYNVGYPENQRCENIVIIPAKNEAKIYLNENNIEMYSDKLFLNYGSNETISIQVINPSYYTLLQGVNGSSLIFESDGNTKQSGYSVTVKTYECKCAGDFALACDQEKIMWPLVDDVGMYCDNMTCNYNILTNASCPDAYFYVFIYPTLRSLDYLVFKDNGVTRQNITYIQRLTYPIYYSSKAKLSFEFSSGISKDLVSPNPKNWVVVFSNSSKPNFTKLNLTESTPNTHAVWLDSMNKNDAITVCGENLEMFVTNSAFYSLSNYQLYDADDLYSNIGNLDSKLISSPSATIARSLKSSSGCFTLYKISESSQDTQATVLFKKANSNTNNCMQKDTVFLPRIYGDNFEISSTNSGSCEMIILIGSAGIPRIWLSIKETTPNSKYEFTDLAINKKLFELNSTEVSQYETLGIYTTALSITVPPSSKISLTASNSITQTIYIQSISQKGIMTSPHYSSNPTLNNTLLYNFQQHSSVKNITANFLVKEFIGSPIIELQVDAIPRQT
uniref:CUB-like domain-containing protein n=1 Tax=Panagrolaimus sp. ES5 TaxID=591445 RepID=A0AC34FD40_9BILA